MKQNSFPLSIAAGLFAILVGSACAQSSPTFKVLASFDYPGALSTNVFKINDSGAIACGTSLDVFHTFGVVRFRDGHFSRLLTAPNDDNMTTVLTGINDSGSFCGNYGGGDDHAFVVINSVFTEVRIPGSVYNYVWAINDADDYCGSYYYNGGSAVAGFLSVGGNITTLSIPGGTYTSVEGISNLGQAVGYYSQTSTTGFGFFRDADGTLTFPIAVSGDAQTYLEAINDAGWMVGFARRASRYHGVFFSSPDQSSLFMYPGARDTFIYGINNKGIISGKYYDGNGLAHGFLAQVKL